MISVLMPVFLNIDWAILGVFAPPPLRMITSTRPSVMAEEWKNSIAFVISLTIEKAASLIAESAVVTSVLQLSEQPSLRSSAFS